MNGFRGVLYTDGISVINLSSIVAVRSVAVQQLYVAPAEFQNDVNHGFWLIVVAGQIPIEVGVGFSIVELVAGSGRG